MRAILLLSALLTLCACSKEDVETANFGSDYFKADYQLINATPLELDFYIANSALTSRRSMSVMRPLAKAICWWLEHKGVSAW